MRNLLIFFFFFVLLVSQIEAAKKKKITKDVGRPRPKEINSRLYCRACQLMTMEVLKKIGDSRTETDIYAHLPNQCFRLWGHPTQPPQDILKACWAFMDGREDMIAEILMQRESAEQAIELLCDTLTKACEGVNLKMPGMTVNGQRTKPAQPNSEAKPKPANTEL